MLKERFHTKRWAGWFLLVGGIVMAVAGVWYAVEGVRQRRHLARVENAWNDGVALTVKL